MEDRYRKDVQDGRARCRRPSTNASKKGQGTRARFSRRTVQTGFDRETGKPVYEDENLEFEAMPYIVGGGGRSRRPDDGVRQGD